MNRVRTPVEVPPVESRPEHDGRPPLVSPYGGWEPKVAPFNSVHELPDGKTLEVGGVHGSWNHVAGLDADERDPDVVVLTLTLASNDRPEGGSGWHTAVGIRFRAQVRLQRPLAGRRVIDDALPTVEQVRADEARAAIAGRRRHGLPAEPALVERLLDALEEQRPDVERHWFGFPVTSGENAELLQIQREMEELFDAGHAWVHAGHDDVYAGSIHAWEPEVAILKVTDEGAATELRSVLAGTGWSRYEVRVVRYSEAELKPLIRRSMDLLRDAGFDVRGAGLGGPNRVQVHIWDDEDLPGAVARAEALLAGELPPDSFVVGP